MNQKGARMKAVHRTSWSRLGKCRFESPFGVASMTTALLIGSIATAALAEPGAETCLLAADEAALRNAVPPQILRGLSTYQSGKAQDGQTLPWPWTIEVSGTRRWFSDRDSARTFARQLETGQIETYSIGCFLLDSELLRRMSIPASEFIDPARNAEIAAQALETLYQQTGSWTEASQILRSDGGTVPEKQRFGKSGTRNGSEFTGFGSLMPVSDPARLGD